MRRSLTSVALATLIAATAGCSSNSSGAPATAGPAGSVTTIATGSSDASATTDGTPSTSSASTPTDATDASLATDPVVTDTTAPPGDGKWHPQLHDSTLPAMPELVSNLLDGQPITTIGAAPSLYDPRAFAIVVASACSAVQDAMAAKAGVDGLTVVANGADAASGWFVVESSVIDGANLALTPDADTTSCDIAGIPLTPASLTFDGPVATTVTAAVGITCGVGSNGGIGLGLWGFPVGDPAGSIETLFVSTVDNPAPGVHQVSNSEDDGSIALATVTNGTPGAWTFAQFLTTLTGVHPGDVPPGFTALAGTVTLAEGLQSGSIDVADGSEHITGTFACGSPIVADAPAG